MANLDVTVDGNLTNNTTPDFSLDRLLIIDAGSGTLQDIILSYLLTALKESGGPTVLNLGAIADGQFLKRSTTNVIGAAVLDSDLSTSDIATNNVTTAKHGLMPKGDNNADHFYRSDLTQAVTPYILYGIHNQFSPADGTTYYFGQSHLSVPISVAANRKIFIPRGGTITRVDIAIGNNGGTTGSNETSTISLRLNNTTDTTLTTSFLADMASPNCKFFNITGLSIAVATGDYVEFKWVTPPWATNPTNIIITGQIYIS